MPYCRLCKQKVGLIDWDNHAFSEHMNEQARGHIRRRLEKQQAERRKKWDPNEDPFAGLNKDYDPDGIWED